MCTIINKGKWCGAWSSTRITIIHGRSVYSHVQKLHPHQTPHLPEHQPQQRDSHPHNTAHIFRMQSTTHHQTTYLPTHNPQSPLHSPPQPNTPNNQQPTTHPLKSDKEKKISSPTHLPVRDRQPSSPRTHTPMPLNQKTKIPAPSSHKPTHALIHVLTAGKPYNPHPTCVRT